ncbi:LCP family protein [Streptomyces xiamenensis]|uniref:LCP family protein n=1 Tax=Streptomyces xiamenensis TaxID=408015 RepID=UPI003D756D70
MSVRFRIAATLAALLLTVSGVGHAVVSKVEHGVERVDPFAGLRDQDRPDGDPGLNLLVIGTDTREGLTDEERRAYHLGGEGCHCADSIMLVHLSATGERASIVSLPRDTLTALPEPAKLNAALSRGGPELMVSAVESLTDLRIDHYLEVNFVSFMRAVDAVGGVEVCTPRPLQDEKSGLDLPAGTSTLTGGEALQYARARTVDPTADFGRMQRQQRLLAALATKALATPARIPATAEALLTSVRADPGFGAQEMLDLAEILAGPNRTTIDYASVPVADRDHAHPDLGSTVLWNEREAAALFATLKKDLPLPTPKTPTAATTHPTQPANDTLCE